jgi:hypothetical protein
MTCAPGLWLQMLKPPVSGCCQVQAVPAAMIQAQARYSVWFSLDRQAMNPGLLQPTNGGAKLSTSYGGQTVLTPNPISPRLASCFCLNSPAVHRSLTVIVQRAPTTYSRVHTRAISRFDAIRICIPSMDEGWPS